MSTPRSLIRLDLSSPSPIDASRIGNVVRPYGRFDLKSKKQGIRFDSPGHISVGSNEELCQLEDFTVEVQFKPESSGKKQQLIESDSLPVSICLEPDGRLSGAVFTDKGWETIDSGDVKIGTDEETKARLIYSKEGSLSLEINGHHVDEVPIKGELLRQGHSPIIVGTKLDARSNQFYGTISGLRVMTGAVSTLDQVQLDQKAVKLATQLKRNLDFAGNINVFLDPDTVDHRFDRIKAILTAAGVEDLSQIAKLSINKRTVIQKNTIMVAPRKSDGVSAVNWNELAKTLASVDAKTARYNLAVTLPNSKSISLINNDSSASEAPVSNSSTRIDKAIRPVMETKSQLNISGNVVSQASKLRYEPTKNKFSTSQRLALQSIKASRVTDVLRLSQKLQINKPEILDYIKDDLPDMWPVHNLPMFAMTMATLIPIDTSVIIAGQLDLTNQTLVIEPDVKTLYIIAEEIIAASNASITWRRPGGSTPARNDDPSKNGRSYSGVHTAEGSRNGLRGGDGVDGDPGIGGQDGRDAPHLEIWVKNLTAMPDIDLNGEDGITGGRGQRGGRGGNGARGQTGKWWWLFGAHCFESPGHGGNGGDGGRGGRGGPGGGGGNAGNVSIGVLEGTLAESVQARAFRIKNQGGDGGNGGDGGSGGLGGNGGTHGNDYVDGHEVCGNGVDGTHGAQGQPGTDGSDGRSGQDGTLNFFEFTEESWNEQLTRPWLYELTPTEVFPERDIVITGTRFADTDRIVFDGIELTPRELPDESVEITIPWNTSGGEKELYVKRFNGVQSNRLRCWVKPWLDDSLSSPMVSGSEATLQGRAFMTGASVLYNGTAVPALAVTPTTLRFIVPSAGVGDTSEQDVVIAVRNPDGFVSNERTITLPRIIDSGFKVDVHGLAFPNFDDGIPSWGTFKDTFGEFEVWHELLDPIFGHPLLTAAFYIFYEHFLKGEGNGGLATGFCTSLSALVLDEFWQGSSDTYSRITLDNPTHQMLTAIHGRLLSRESLIDFHNQGRRGTANVETTFRRIEANLGDGGDRHSALMLFFVPSGAVWDAGYFDSLGDSHCIVPYRIVYPKGHDGVSIDGVKMYCWDCNHPYVAGSDDAMNCRLEFRMTDGEIRFDYFDGGSSIKFRSENNITLATMNNGKYLLSDHDLPFSGPLGLTTFVLDFLLSPADLLVENSMGQLTGHQGGSIVAEIPDSHPCFLVKGAYLLPANEALTRQIIGNASGNYTYHSIAPNGVSLSLEDIDTSAGQTDVLASNADGTMIRFTPGVTKNFVLNLARESGDQARAISINGIGGSLTAPMELNLSPDLSVIRISNVDTHRTVDVQVSQIEKATGSNGKLNRNAVDLPINHDLMITVTDWDDLALTVRAIPLS